MIRKLHQRGFTIIELMIATAVLSTILVLTTILMTNIANLYYKGVNQARVQDAVRSITDDLAQQLRLNDLHGTTPPSATGPNGEQAYCIGSIRYTYILDTQIGHQAGSPPSGPTFQHVLWRDTNPQPGSCFIDSSDPNTTSPVDLTQDPASNDPNGTELIAPNSRLTGFTITGTSPYTLSVGVAYGDTDLLNLSGIDTTCKGGIGDRFCSTARLETTVVQRL